MKVMPRAAATAVAFLGAASATAQQPDFNKVEIKVTRVADNIYMLEGAGGNIGVSVGDDGIVIVDDQFAPLADKIRAALKGITDKPVRFVINTHHHFDHTGGNPAFQPGAPIIAHDNVRKHLEKGGPAGTGGALKIDMPAQTQQGLPILTFDHSMTLHLNGEDIRALHFPNGHTDGDSVVFFPKANVVHMGDDFVTYGFPFIDILGGGSVKGMISACEHIIQQLPPDVKVIPGHGPVSSLDDIRKFSAMLKDTATAVQMQINGGKTLEQMRQANVLEPWQKYSGEFINTDAFLDTLYNDLTGKKAGKPLQH
jgi:cyclase